MRVCSVDGCDRPSRRRGWCAMHYERWRVHGNPITTERPRYESSTCAVLGCQRPRQGRGWCLPHYKWWLHTGTAPTGPVGKIRCNICRHPDVLNIDAWLFDGGRSRRSIREEYGFSNSTIQNHMRLEHQRLRAEKGSQLLAWARRVAS